MAQTDPNNVAQTATPNNGSGALYQNPIAGADDTQPRTPTTTPTSYKATDWKVTPDQTVQGQMTSLIDPNNPFYQSWATAGKQDAAASGFTNGSMQQTGIINSVMKNAIPIATSDANVNASAASTNAGATNQASAAGALAANNLANTNINTASQQLISKTHDENSTLLQNSKAATDAYNSFVNNVAAIQASTTMNQAAKDAAIANQHDIFNNQIAGLKATTPGIPDISSNLAVGTDAPAASVQLTANQQSWDKQYSSLSTQLANTPQYIGQGRNNKKFNPEWNALKNKIRDLGPRPS